MPVSRPGQLEPARRLAGDVVEVRRLAADHGAERDDARVAARLRERHRRERQLERPGNGHDRDRLAAHARPLELVQRPGQQLARELTVEAPDDDADGAATPLGSPWMTP